MTDSVCYAEIVAASTCVAEMMYHLLLTEELGDGTPIEPAALFVDTLAAVQISKDPVTANKMKHVARRHFYVRDVQEMGLIRVC